MNQTNQRIRLTKKILVESLLNIAEKKPLMQISVRELCVQSQISRSTFYIHYDTLETFIEEQVQEFINYMPLFDLSMPEEKIREDISVYVNYIIKNHKKYMIFYENHCLERIIIQELKSRETVMGNQQIYSFLVDYTVHGTLATLYEWIRSPKSISEETISEIVFKLAYKAALLLKSQK